MAKTFKRVGQMLLSKGGRYYLKFENQENEPITIESGDALMLQKPADQIDRLVEAGKITEQEAAEKKEKVPAFVKFNVIQVSGE